MTWQLVSDNAGITDTFTRSWRTFYSCYHSQTRFIKGCITKRKESAPLWSVHRNCSIDNVQITLLLVGSGVKIQADNKGRSGHATPSSLHLFKKGDWRYEILPTRSFFEKSKTLHSRSPCALSLAAPYRLQLCTVLVRPSTLPGYRVSTV